MTAAAVAPRPWLSSPEPLAEVPFVPLSASWREVWQARLWRRFHALSLPALPPGMEAVLRHLPTGGWRIRRDTAVALAALFAATKPHHLLELGSGVSTLWLASLCAAAVPPARVISLEENAKFADQTRSMLRHHGVSDYATVVVAPVQPTTIGGWRGQTYRPDDRLMLRALSGGAVDFVFIDGPASWGRGRGDCRYGALPLVRRWAAAECVFALDDAWRRRDFAILKRWNELPGVVVRGIIPVERGIGVGMLQRLGAVT